MQIAVIYLARKTEGVNAFRSFIQSYLAHPAGIAHDLAIIFKGFHKGKDLNDAQALFSSVPFISLELPDEGFDIGSYFAAAKQLDHEHVCFLNTFSRILADDWLLKFYRHASDPKTGIVGATGSYEGLRSYSIVQPYIWLNSQPRLSYGMRYYLEKQFGLKCVSLKIDFTPSSLIHLSKFCINYILGFIPGWNRPSCLKLRYRRWRRSFEKTHKEFLNRFPSFPNPHIRTNAFMIRRKKFLDLKAPAFHTKTDTCAFESGHEHMTKQLLSHGLKAILLTKDGTGYDISDWPKSKTFRLGNQENLLIADNQTDLFMRTNEQDRLMRTLMAWGENSYTSLKNFEPNLEKCLF